VVEEKIQGYGTRIYHIIRIVRTRYKFQSNTAIYYTKYSYGNMFRLYWVIIRPCKEQIQCIKIYSAFWDTKRLRLGSQNAL